MKWGTTSLSAVGPSTQQWRSRTGVLEWYLCLCFWWLIGFCVCISVSMSTSWQRGSERLLWWIVWQLSISRKRNQRKKKVVSALCFVQFLVTVSVSVWSLYVSFLLLSAVFGECWLSWGPPISKCLHVVRRSGGVVGSRQGRSMMGGSAFLLFMNIMNSIIRPRLRLQ